MMINSTLVRNKVNFGNNSSGIITSPNQQSVKNLEAVNKRLSEIIQDIGGIPQMPTVEDKVLVAKEKIKMLRRETQDAWGNCPSVLKTKMEALDKLDKELTRIDRAAKGLNEQIENEKPGLIIPGKPDLNAEDLVTSTLDALAIYNSLPKDPAAIKERMKQGPIQSQLSVPADMISMTELKNSLKSLEKDTWDFEKFNVEDSKLFPKLVNAPPDGTIRNILKEQVLDLTKKIDELKGKGNFIPEVGVKLYSPALTGKIMALETAKLRRSVTLSGIIMPNTIENLDKPDVMLQPISGGSPQPFKIDKSETPSASDMKEILELNKPYQPILKKHFPEGLDVYVIPGYSTSSHGKMEGGISVPGQPEAGVFLTSYDTQERYDFVTSMEAAKAHFKEIKGFKYSVLPHQNMDRARALAHEIGHVISYKLMNDANEQNHKTSGSLILIGDSAGLDFYSGWKGLRGSAKLTNEEFSRKELSRMAASDAASYHEFVNYEKIAEDIRIAVVGDRLPASSKMTGIFDATPEGKEQLEKSIGYIRQCLIENKDPSIALVDAIASKV